MSGLRDSKLCAYWLDGEHHFVLGGGEYPQQREKRCACSVVVESKYGRKERRTEERAEERRQERMWAGVFKEHAVKKLHRKKKAKP